MSAQPENVVGGLNDLPPLLTVEEAAKVLRVGRTKAYAMTREWRSSGGRSGLPVIDLGSVLRVPRRALEEIVGNSILLPVPQSGDKDRMHHRAEHAAPTRVDDCPSDTAASRPPRRAARDTRPAAGPSDQLALFDPPPVPRR